MINEEVRHFLEVELHPDEKLLWADRPARRPYPWRGVYRAGFWFLWMLFAVFWTLGVLTTSRHDPSLPVRLIFGCLGVFFLFIGYTMRRTYLKALLGPKYEIYGLTNKRAIILSPLWKDHQFINWRGQDHSKNLIEGEELIPMKVILSVDKEIGTIIFAGWWDKIRFTWFIHPNPDSPKILSNLNGFRNIRDAAKVAGLIEENFETLELSGTVERLGQENQAGVIHKLRSKRIFLWSIFPLLWIVFTFTVGASSWLFLSFFTLPFFFVSVFYAVREIIRPPHSYRTPS